MKRHCYIGKGEESHGLDDSDDICSFATEKVSNKSKLLKNVANKIMASKVPHNDDEKDIDTFSYSRDSTGSVRPSIFSDLTSSDQSNDQLDDDLKAELEATKAEFEATKAKIKAKQRKRNALKHQQQEETKKEMKRDHDDSNSGGGQLPVKGEAGA